ncbi:hypothetical protein CERSUDRAFT_66899 [Gelatoporia subvermispora B]|uniref:Uncharacterized protein n=1 Tax=Ceriporiopsis subvermispora (strain B) TaxID=914234 RepID=M2PGF0_CERS8|nr:hypothetical protein CERSUDRAFT_66899 [Gelatoporia subvermispora B]
MGIFNEAIPNPGASHGNYAKNLFHLGFGLPLWHPRPLKTGDILIGDVGFMRHGIIYKLFNATTPADNDLASREVDLVDRGAPTPLGVAIDNSKLCVGTVLPAVLCDLDTFPAAGADAKGGVFLATKGPSGSALVIPDGARRVHLNPESIHDVITLIRQHHRAWHARASNFDCITSASHTLVLVTGYVHSARWSAATFDHANTPDGRRPAPFGTMASTCVGLQRRDAPFTRR